MWSNAFNVGAQGLVSWYSITGKNSNIEELLLVILGAAETQNGPISAS